MSDLPWSCVHHTADRIAVIASGPSLRDVDLDVPDGVTTIAVNAAVQHLPFTPDFWFTLDLSKANRELIARPRTGVIYYAAAHPPHPTVPMPSCHVRPEGSEHVHWLKRIHGKHGRSGKLGLSESPKGIHAGNSGYGALGLAYLMKPTKIAILGIDATSGYAWGNGSPRDLSYLPHLFASAGKQLEQKGIQVRNGSPTSRIRAWEPRMAPNEALAWLAS